MNRRRFFWISVFCVAIPLAYLGWGICLLVWPKLGDWTHFKDLIPLVIAIPLAILAASWQRRTSYLQALRDLWKQLVPAAHDAIEFARNGQRYEQVEKELSEAIEMVRGVFERPRGLFPFENLHSMYRLVTWLNGNPTAAPYTRPQIEQAITNLWKEMREEMLKEFDRGAPYSPVSKFLHNGEDISDKISKGTAVPSDFL